MIYFVIFSIRSLGETRGSRPDWQPGRGEGPQGRRPREAPSARHRVTRPPQSAKLRRAGAVVRSILVEKNKPMFILTPS